jgi:hypothetical protein
MPASAEWTSGSHKVKAPTDATKICAILLYDGVSSAYIDDVVISDSKGNVREILVEKDEILTDMYQSQAAWYKDQEGVAEYFILLSASEYQTVSGSEWWTSRMEHCHVRSFNESGYYIFVFSENIWTPHGSELRNAG